MALFTAVQNGDFTSSATWDLASGFPGSADTFFIGPGLTVTIPSGVKVTSTGTIGGSDESTRGSLIISGRLNLSGNFQVNNYNHLQVDGGAILDFSGFSIIPESFNPTGAPTVNSIQFVGASDNRATIMSSVAGQGGFVYHGIIVIKYCDFVDTGKIETGSARRGFNGIDVEWVTFTGCEEIYLGGYYSADSFFNIRHVDVRDDRSSTGNCLVVEADPYEINPIGSGVHNPVSHITVTPGIASNVRWALGGITRECIVTDKVVSVSVINDNPEMKESLCRIETDVVENGFFAKATDCYFLAFGPNPHTIGRSGFIDSGVIEATYEAGLGDDGDHYIMRSSGNGQVENVLVVEKASGVLLNALGNAIPGQYSGKNNTLFGQYDNAYGALFRTESGGSVTGTLDLYSNLVVNAGTDQNALGLNVDNGLSDQITNMDYNAWVNIGQPYSGVTSATKTAGSTVGYGGNDLIDRPPMFKDSSRDFASWSFMVTGTATTQAGADHLLKINGYNPILKTQVPSEAVSERPIDAVNWVRTGFISSQPDYAEGAGFEGANIGITQIDTDPVVNIGRITRRNLTSRAMTRRSLTARP